MTRFTIVLFVALTTFLSTVSLAEEPVNSDCPFTGNPVNPEVTTKVGEDSVAFCCGGCLSGFNKWEDERKATYVAEQKASNAKSYTKDDANVLYVKTPYLLDTCPITGKKLDSMGGEVVEIINGREVRFCCASCPEKFKSDKEAQFKILDVLMIKQQLPFYPTDTCLVSGKTLDFHGGAINFIYGNRLFRTCCNNCKSEFLDDPAKFVPEIDDIIIKTQKKTYPLTTCVIGKGPLDGMGGPDNMIVGNRLVQLCCGSCRPKVLSNPLAAFALIDAAK